MTSFAIELLQRMENDARNNNVPNNDARNNSMKNENEKMDEKIWGDEEDRQGTNKFGRLHIFLWGPVNSKRYFKIL